MKAWHPARLVLITAGAMSLAFGTPGTALADVSDAGEANLTNALDIADALSKAPDPDVTCRVDAAGMVITQRTVTPRASLDAQTLIAGAGECVSLNTARGYAVSLTVIEEAFIRGKWTPVCSLTQPNSSTAGVAYAVAQRFCSFTTGSPALNRFHRAHAILTTNVGTTPRHAYSPTFFITA